MVFREKKIEFGMEVFAAMDTHLQFFGDRCVEETAIILHLLRRRKIDDGGMRMFSDFPYRSALHRQSLDLIVELAMGAIKLTGFFQELQVSIHSIRCV